jgi:hypothetical protein
LQVRREGSYPSVYCKLVGLPLGSEIDHQHYVLHVDLWDEKGEKEYNLVKHTQNQSSIGAGSVASFREVLDTQNSAYGYPAIVPSNRDGYAPAQGAYPPHMAPYQSDPYAQQSRLIVSRHFSMSILTMSLRLQQLPARTRLSTAGPSPTAL